MRFATVATVAATLITSAVAACSSSALTLGTTQNPTSAPYAGETLQMGTNFTITWTPNTAGPITILLLAGPTAANLSVIDTVATNVTNSGSYTWTIPTAGSGLSSTLTSGYGLQLVDESSCVYQYSPNFGIENPKAVTSTITLKYASSTITSAVTAVTGAATGTGSAKVTSPVLSPTKSMTVPASLKATSTAATASSASAASTASASKGLAVPTGVVGWNTGAMMVAGMVGALVL